MGAMRARARNTAARLLGALAVLAGPAAGILAAAGKDSAPELKSSLAWWPLLVTVAALLGVAAVGFKNARRLHD